MQCSKLPDARNRSPTLWARSSPNPGRQINLYPPALLDYVKSPRSRLRPIFLCMSALGMATPCRTGEHCSMTGKQNSSKNGCAVRPTSEESTTIARTRPDRTAHARASGSTQRRCCVSCAVRVHLLAADSTASKPGCIPFADRKICRPKGYV